MDLDQLTTKILEYGISRGFANQTSSDLAKSIIIEAAELLEHFQWSESKNQTKQNLSLDWQEIEYEVADILWYLIVFCHENKLNILTSLTKKLKYNEEKYPLTDLKGSAKATFYAQQKLKYKTKKLAKISKHDQN